MEDKELYKHHDLTGMKFGRLTVIDRRPKDNHRRATWLCECACGNTTVVAGTNLVNHYTKSCGCLFAEINTGITQDINGKNKKIYSVWCGMRRRCNSLNNDHFIYYGSRGIKVCKEWEKSFKKFNDWAMANGYKEGLSIERINNNGNYDPDNCTWIPLKDQVLNKRHYSNRKLARGVSWHKASNKWYARVTKNKKAVFAKLYKDYSEACIEVKKAREEIFGRIEVEE